MIHRSGAVLVLLFAFIAPTSAVAESQPITITSVDFIDETGPADVLNVNGHGQCAVAGFVSLNVRVTDLETGSRASNIASTRCMFAGETIMWDVRVTNLIPSIRPGDHVQVAVTASGAIVGTDEKTTVA